MTTIGVVMAGGRGERMRASGISVPKPLVPVGGVPLLVRAVCSLLRHDLTDVLVSVPAAEPEIARVADTEARHLVEAAGGRLDLLVEDRPLGNIGAVRAVHGRADHALVIYADNLTTLDIAALLRHHTAARAAVTLATHEETFRLPYGRLTLHDGDVVAYDEKPEIRVQVASAVTALSAAALEVLPSDHPTGMVHLCQEMLRRGGRISAYLHAAPWVDVNDASTLTGAHALLSDHGAELELWWRDPPVREQVLVLGIGRVLVREDGTTTAGTPWATADAVLAADGPHLTSELPPVELDALDGNHPVRYRIRPFIATGAAPVGWRWLSGDAAARWPMVTRTLAAVDPGSSGRRVRK